MAPAASSAARAGARPARARLRKTDYFIYQALVGIWPIGAAAVQDDDACLAELRERLTAYIQKSVREAKLRTSWTDPDEEYEAAISTFIAALLDRASPGRYLRDVAPLVADVGATGLWNALARLVVHLTAPGVPDIYRGDELWFQALVDPDNRRPVDWEARVDASRTRCIARDAEPGFPPLEVLRGWRDRIEDGTLKMYLTSRLLRLRRDDGIALTGGAYSALRAEGTHAGRVVAYRRGSDASARIILVPRLTTGLGEGAPIGSRWGDTRLATGTSGVLQWPSGSAC